MLFANPASRNGPGVAAELLYTHFIDQNDSANLVIMGQGARIM